jgi:pyrroloquinoline quinone biosynthesis protein B
MRWIACTLRQGIVCCLFVAGGGSRNMAQADEADVSGPFVVVLGVAQDAGIPQAGAHTHPAWQDSALQRRAACLGLIDPVSGRRWLFEATPDLRPQLYALDRVATRVTPTARHDSLIDGIFLTHAHIGHYTGLMFLGHESMGAHDVAVYAMPRMAAFLRSNGPWDQLVRYENIVLHELVARQPLQIAPSLRVIPLPVPHRQEYSEVVGYRIEGPRHRVLFLPDIDSWHELDSLGVAIEDWIADVDVAFLDGTFFDNGEIPGRDMSGFPHPFIAHSMRRFAALPAEEKDKIHFIHFNHTNPVGLPGSEEGQRVEAAGFHLAREGDRFDL